MKYPGLFGRGIFFVFFPSIFHSMQILSASASRFCDQQTIEKQGITSLQLMERAAGAFCKAFLRRFPPPGRGLIVCGPGNNGGDGLVLARLLANENHQVSVFIPAHFTRFSNEFLENKKLLPASVPVFEGGLENLKQAMENSGWICDALFGSGLNRPLEDPIHKIVQHLNAYKALKISIDIPTGLMFPMPEKMEAFQADWTGTFQSPKLEFLLPETGQFTKEFEIIPIGLETKGAEGQGPPLYYVEKSEIQSLVRSRGRFTHKGQLGHGLLLAGSEGKIGAAILSARAMMRIGAGLGSVSLPRSGRTAMHSSLPEVMILNEENDHILSTFPDLLPFDAAGIGPGIGQAEETSWILKELIFTAKIPLVLDADALNMLAHHPDWHRHLPEGTILTPHLGEWQRLVGYCPHSWDYLEKAREFAQNHRVIVVLKGAFTRICLPDGSVHFNATGNPGMASGGMGDVLTGILTGLLAQGYTPEASAKLGVYLHGLAGDLAAKMGGYQALLASDVIDSLGLAWKNLQA